MKQFNSVYADEDPAEVNANTIPIFAFTIPNQFVIDSDSQATDSEANMSFLSEDTKTEAEDTADSNIDKSSFKMPLSEKKKKQHRKHRTSDPIEPNDDDPGGFESDT